MLTPGNVSDMKVAPALLERARRMRYLLGDKGYDADSLRSLARDAGATPVILTDASAVWRYLGDADAIAGPTREELVDLLNGRTLCATTPHGTPG